MSRIEVLKTYKIFIGGAFPRTESGRFYQPIHNKLPIGNMCLSSKKDIRNAVVAARKAQGAWANKSAYNRCQILYRIAEMLEGRKAQFESELQTQGSSSADAIKEVETSIDRLIYYAGWCDKYQQIFSSVNPVASSHFNFSACEPTGVVTALAPQQSGLLGLVSAIAPVIAGGNTILILASEKLPLCSVSFAEVIATSDVPGGVVNIITGYKTELLSHLATHKDVNAMLYCGEDQKDITSLQKLAVDNLKRIVIKDTSTLATDDWENPYFISDFQETKTTWHPIEQISGAGSGY
jgi:acyl-CoA reductase-like NAD-dependent aldehyde dehydrogenase